MSERVFLGDVVRVIHGKNQRDVESEEGAYPIYGSGGIMGRANDYLCPAHTVIVGRKGTINHPIYVDEPFWNVDTAFGLVADKDRLLPRYLFHFCGHYDFMKLNTAATIPSLTKKSIQGISLMLPKVSVQRESCTKLDFVLSEIDEEQSMLESFDELVKSRFIEMFGDPGINERGLPTDKLANLGILERGKSKHRPRNAPELRGGPDGPYPLVQTGDVTNAGLYLTEYNDTYTELGLQQSKMWDKGTLCITIAANIAQTSILAFDACFPDSVVGFVPGDRVTNVYLHYWFSFFQGILEAQAPQAAQKNINLKILSELDVVLPPMVEQERFISFVQQVDKLKFETQQAIEKLQMLYDSLAQEYFGS